LHRQIGVFRAKKPSDSANKLDNRPNIDECESKKITKKEKSGLVSCMLRLHPEHCQNCLGFQVIECWVEKFDQLNLSKEPKNLQIGIKNTERVYMNFV
jgi:hypothetical protein